MSAPITRRTARTHVLIPAYRPDRRLLSFVADLLAAAPHGTVLIVDDGSGQEYEAVFAAAHALGAGVCGYRTNRGKGHALKYGFERLRHDLAEHPEPTGDDVVVCADADGQHSVVDVLRVAGAVRDQRTTVLGVRVLLPDDAHPVKVPLRSRFGNRVTRTALALATRRSWQDTQTGLRGYPAALLSWLVSVEGERYEYETNLLLAASRDRLPVNETAVATIYLDDNASSHFRPLADSARIYAPLLYFAAVALGSFVLDATALLLLNALTGNLIASVIGARAISSVANFAGNRWFTFRGGTRPLASAARRYWALVVIVLIANAALMHLLTGWGLGLPAAKLITETLLFLTGFVVQRRSVFGAPSTRHTDQRTNQRTEHHAERYTDQRTEQQDATGSQVRHSSFNEHAQAGPREFNSR